MYQNGNTVWAVIHKFSRPKECIIKNRKSMCNLLNGETVSIYTVEYKHRFYEIRNEDTYPTQIDADIYWSLLIQDDYYQSLKYPDLFLTDEYEMAFTTASDILRYYAEEYPHILMKYI